METLQDKVKRHYEFSNRTHCHLRVIQMKATYNFRFLKQGLLCVLLSIVSSISLAEKVWRGLVVEPEYRCSPYDKKSQYPYPQSVEDEIVTQMGGHVYGPYTGRYFSSDTQTDIEHIVAASEGHDSGLCSASPETRRSFAQDLLNLTLAAPEVNRCGSGGKCGFDAGEWLPEKNQCWFANRVVEIKSKYNLSVDQVEADSLEAILSLCESFEMIIYSPQKLKSVTFQPQGSASALSMYDDNGNGRITCAEARIHGIAPVKRGHPAYKYMRDGDGDGVVCE